MDPAAVTPQSFDLISIFLNSDWVVKLVMIGLGIASLWSWTIILDKLVRLRALNSEADKFEDVVSSGRSLEGGSGARVMTESSSIRLGASWGGSAVRRA